MQANIKEITAKVTGRVQLVMYRDFVQRKARTLKLTGTVKNMTDGSVYVVAQGGGDELEKFIDHLREGSFLARVDDVRVEWHGPQKGFEGFTIVY